MATLRQDAWSDEDDSLLAEVTLKHISEGSTQLLAFEEVGEKLGRTSAACGFRWNSYVRKKYDAAIHVAKSERQKRNKLQKKSVAAFSSSTCKNDLGISALSRDIGSHDYWSDEQLSIDHVIRFLRQWRQSYVELSRQVKYLERELAVKDEEVQKLLLQNERLHQRVSEVSSDYQVVNDDYKALIQIMDRARKMAFLQEDCAEDTKPRFKMDENGNLERIDLGTYTDSRNL